MTPDHIRPPRPSRPTRRSRLLAAGLLAATGLGLGAAGASADPGGPGSPGGPGGPGASAGPTRAAEASPARLVPAVPGVSALGTDGRGWRPRDSSDGRPGELAPPVPLDPRGQTPVSTRRLASWQVVPGVRARIIERRDARGPVRAALLRVDLTEPGLRLDYARRGPVAHTAPLSRILAKDGAVAGINADFFDINRTGAPLGTGLDRDRGLLHGRVATWNESFVLGPRDRPAIGTVAMEAVVVDRPRFAVTNLNSPFVAPGGIGVYTRAWGRAPGYLATQDQRRGVRVVQVRDGVVTSVSRRPPTTGRVEGLLLVGRDRGARQLGRLEVGDPLAVRRRLEGDPRMAVTGDRVLVRDGVVAVTDDTEMHPRTAIGIDDDTGRVLMLVVDGRQDFSRGLTMVELARLMVDLGAEQALNLDGGGSSTMVARRRDGTVGVVNSPSDGAERPVADAVQLTYRAPRP